MEPIGHHSLLKRVPTKASSESIVGLRWLQRPHDNLLSLRKSMSRTQKVDTVTAQNSLRWAILTLEEWERSIE